MLTYRMHKKLAGHDKDFLVSQHHSLTGSRGGQRRLQAGGTDDGGHHRIDLGMRGHIDQCLDTVPNLGFQPGSPATLLESLGQMRIAQHRIAWPELKALLEQLVTLGMRT